MSNRAALPEGVLDAIIILERVGSILSIVGCLFIIITFLSSTALRKPINRLVFYASFGNMLVNVGTLIARTSINDRDSVGCQLQAFLIQQFLPSDALWALAMALNVYLTFYHKFDAEKLRGMEKWYLLICYGLPLPPALSFIFISTPSKGRIYGDAVLWCWVDNSWDILRIATFYAPIWVIISATFFIYIRTGREIYEKRRQLRKLDSSTGSGLEPEVTEAHELYPVKTTEISITSNSVSEAVVETASMAQGAGRGPAPPTPKPQAYSITITSGREPPAPSTAGTSATATTATATSPITIDAPTTNAARAYAKARRRRNQEAGNAALAYTKCAVLFFTALTVTWIPSSANRVYSLAHEGRAVIALEILSAIVLPLQGFWNALIYLVTSWAAVKLLFTEAIDRASFLRWPRRGGSSGGGGSSAQENGRRSLNFNNFRHSWNHNGSNNHKGGSETDSMTELAENATPISKLS